MANKIMVDPAMLDSTAQKIEQQATDYKSLYSKLYGEIDGIAAAWDGVDHVAFVNQINGFKDDFQKMAQHMEEYVAFLRKAAQAYRDTQNRVIQGAKQLRN